MGPILIWLGLTVISAHSTLGDSAICKKQLRILLGCSLQLPLLGPIMPVTLVCVLVGWTTPHTLKGNL